MKSKIITFLLVLIASASAYAQCTPDAGEDAGYCNATNITLTGNAGGCGLLSTYLWEVSSATPMPGGPLVPAAVIFDNPTGLVTNATIQPGVVYVFSLRGDPFPAGAPWGYDFVTVTSYLPPSPVNAGPDDAICNVPAFYVMGASTPTIGTGTWSFDVYTGSGVPPLINIPFPNDPTATVTGFTDPGDYAFIWTVANGPCVESDVFHLTVNEQPVASIAAIAQICDGDPIPLTSTSNGSIDGYTWQVNGATLGIADPNAASTSYTPSSWVAGATYPIELWVDAAAPCIDDIAYATATIDNTPPTFTCVGNQTVGTDAPACTYTHGSNSLDPTAIADNCPAPYTTTVSSTGVTGLAGNTLNGAVFNKGVTTITWTVADALGNTATCTFTVTVNDDDAPVVTCPVNASPYLVGALGTDCEVTLAEVGTATALDNCDGVVSVTPSVPGPFGPGYHTITWSATDLAGNTGTCTMTITVLDNVNPTAICQNIDLNLDGSGNATLSPSMINNGSNDNCSAVTLSFATPGVVCYDVPDLVAFPITAPAGTVFTQVLAAEYGTSPSVCGDPFFVPGACDAVNEVALMNAIIAGQTSVDIGNPHLILGDPCIATPKHMLIKIAYADISNPFTCANLGPNNVTLYAMDASGNTGNCVSVVTVKDVTAPIISDCGPNVNVNLDASCGLVVPDMTGAVVWTDNCLSATVTQNPIAGSVLPSSDGQVHNIVLTVTDPSNNASSCTTTVTGNDNTPPTITLCHANSSRTADAGVCLYTVQGTEYDITATDNCAGVLSYDWVLTGITLGSGNTTLAGQQFNVGVTTVTWTVSDIASPANTSVCQFEVTVTDDEDPIVTCSDYVFTANNFCLYTIPNATYDATATDNCAVITLTHNVPVPAIAPLATTLNGANFGLGDNFVTWTATDGGGNSASCVSTITVVDITDPIITCAASGIRNTNPGACTYAVIGTEFDPTYLWDNCDVIATHNYLTGGNRESLAGFAFPLGTTIVTWTAEDQSGNSVTCQMTITVTDIENPVITCVGNQTVNANTGVCTYTVSGTAWDATATDNCPSPTVAYVLSGATLGSGSSLNGVAFNLGATLVTWTATDGSSNTAVCSYTVTVFDNQPPVITCPVAPTSFNTGAGDCIVTLAELPVPTVTDNCTSPIIPTSSNPGPFGPGAHSITWTADDGNGNTASCVFNFNVVDDSNPVITCAGNMTVSTDAGVCTYTKTSTSWDATATDNCGIASITFVATGVTPGSGSTLNGYVFGKGVTTVTWTALDVNGNSSSCVDLITVNDNENPIVTCPANVSVNNDPGLCSAVVNYTVIYSDNCPGAVLTQTAGLPSGSAFPVGVTTNSFLVTDASGNTANCSFTVTVVDNELPVVSCVANNTLCTLPGATTYTIANNDFNSTATDNCGIASFSYTISGATTLSGLTTLNGVVLNAGVNNILFNAIDVNTNSNSCAFTLTVIATIEANAGPDVQICNQFTQNLVASDPTPGTGAWSFVSATAMPGAPAYSAPVISPGPNQYTSTVSNLIPGYQYTFRYTVITMGLCTDYDDMVLTDWLAPVTAVAGPDQFHCNVTSTTLTGNNGAALAYGSGLWTYQSSTPPGAPVPFIASPTTPVTGVSGLVGGYTYVFNWSTTNGPVCPSSDEQMSVFNYLPATVDAGLAQTVCPQVTQVNLAGAATNYVGVNWTSNGTGTWNNQNILNAIYYPSALDILNGSVILTLTATPNAPCPVVSDFVIITFQDLIPPTIVCPANVAVNTDLNQCYASGVALGSPTVTDNCGTLAPTNNAPLTFPKGVTVVTWTVFDVNGNSASCTQTVTVTDAQNPSITCPAGQNLNLDAACQAIVPNYTGLATASDNCPGWTVTQVSPAIGSTVSGIGTFNVVLLVTDAVGLTNSCSFVVTKVDAIAPAVTCPGTQNLSLNALCQANLPDYTPMATATDNCPGVTKSQSPVAGTLVSGVGPMTITITATDGSGNSTTCTFTVNKLDITAPSITCPAAQNLTLDALCTALLPDYTSLATTADNCGPITVTQSPAIGTPVSGVGIQVVVLTATDGSGNSSSCAFNVNKLDLTPPSIVCPTTQTLALDVTCSALLPDYTGMAVTVDNCGPITVTQSPAIGTLVSGVGIQVVVLTATDGSGNASSCTFNVSKVDLIAPIITCPANISVNNDPGLCSAVVSFASATATDNCGAVSVAQTSGLVSGSAFPVGVNTVVFTATDGSGNTSSCSFTVTVIDNELPVIICPPNINTNNDPGLCGAEVIFVTNPFTSDNCGVASVTRVPNITIFPVGTTNVVWTVTDVHGNSASCAQTITVDDVELPVITACPPARNINLNASCQLLVPDMTGEMAGTDNCPGPYTFTQSPLAGATLPSAHNGTHIITMTMTDAHGNSSTCTVVLTGKDVTTPVITTCPPARDIAVDGSCSFIVPDLTSEVIYTENCTAVVTQSPAAGTVITTADGATTTVVMTVTDMAGLFTTCSVVLTAQDYIAPVISTCPSDRDVTLDASCQLVVPVLTGEVVASDNCVIASISQSPANGTALASSHNQVHNVTITVTDLAGNSTTCVVALTGKDLTLPVISTCPAPVDVNLNGSCQVLVPNMLGSLVFSDNCSGATASQSPAAGTLLASAHNMTHTVTFTVTDLAGNAVTCTTTLTGKDVTNPVISYCPGNSVITLDANCAFTVPSYLSALTFTDNCSGATATQSPAAGTVLASGHLMTHTITYTVTDLAGNSVTCTQTLTGWDVTPPSITCPADQLVCSDPGSSYTNVFGINATYSDNCDDLTLTWTMTGATIDAGNGDVSGHLFNVGFTTVTYTITDGAGLTDVCSFQVEVRQYQAANAGPDQEWCNNDDAYLLGNFPDPGYTPLWIQVAGPACTIWQVNHEAVVSDLIPGNIYKFVYTLNNGPCFSADTMVLTNFAPPTASIAGPDQILCNATSFTLAGNIALVGTGAWTQVSGPACTITNPASPTTTVTGTTPGSYFFVWTISNGVCQPSVDEVEITNYPMVTAFAGADAIVCPNAPVYTVADANVTNEFAIFWSASGTGYFDDVTSQNPTYYPSALDVIAGQVTLTVTAYGLGVCPSAQDEMVLTINDFVNPVISCGTNQTVNTGNGVCTYTHAGMAWDATATDNCMVDGIVYALSGATSGNGTSLDGVVFNKGITTVTWTATDGVGNTAVCSYTVTVVDNQAPAITCTTNKSVNTDAGVCKHTHGNTMWDATATDNCGVTSLSYNLTGVTSGTGTTLNGVAFNKGVTTVTWTAADAAGLTNSCSFTVTVTDIELPAISCPGNQTVPTDLNVCSYTKSGTSWNATATDNCEVSTLTFTTTGATTISTPGTSLNSVTFAKGVTTVTWKAVDASGNQAVCSFTVTVLDQQAPSITCPANKVVNTTTGQCVAVVTGIDPTVTDNCPGVTYAFSASGATTFGTTAGTASGKTFNKGITTVVYVATDAAGNTSNCTFTVEVKDMQAPSITCPTNKTKVADPGLCAAVMTGITPTFSDNCPGATIAYTTTGATTLSGTGPAEGQLFNVGVTTVTYVVTDASMNTNQCSFTITITDNQAPVITFCPGNKVVTTDLNVCTHTHMTGMPSWDATATDNCGVASLTYTLTGVTTGTGTTLYGLAFNKGVTTVTWSAKDAGNLTTNCVFTVTVNDNQAPALACPPMVWVNTLPGLCSAAGVELGMPTFSDNCSLGSLVPTNNAPAVYPLGATPVTWTLVDASGNTTTCIQWVQVIDEENPVIAGLNNVSVPADAGLCSAASVSLGTPTITDNCIVISSSNNAPATYPVGTTTVTWTAMDGVFNTTTFTQLVTVFDNQAPTISCPSNIATTNPVVSVPLPTTSDNCGVLSVTNDFNGTGNASGTYPVGQTTVVFTVIDIHGNSSTCSFTVTVAPVAPVGNVAGKLTYNNAAQSPMNNSTVMLIQNGSVVETTTTDAAGNFQFDDVNNGSYTLDASTTKPWGGANATDALMVMRHFVQINPLSGLPLEASDVNANSIINSVDALYIAKRFVNLVSSFPSGDWAFETPGVTVNSSNEFVQFKAECYGDVNGSYTPAAKNPATVTLGTAGTLYVNSFGKVELPINTTADLNAGAVSLVVNFPADLFTITNVRLNGANDADVLYTVNGNELRLAWYNTNPIFAKADDALLTLSLSAKDLSSLSSKALELDGATEIADETGSVQNVNLTMPKLAIAEGSLAVKVYPNPASTKTVFSINLPEASTVSIQVFDLLGNVVANVVEGSQNAAGSYNLNFDASTLNQGVYTYRILVSSEKGEEVRSGRLVINR